MYNRTISIIIDVLCGKEKIIKDGELDVIVQSYLEIAIFQEEIYDKVKSVIGYDFDSLLRDRLAESIPAILEMLSNNPVLYAIEEYVYFIIKGCKKAEIPLTDYISMDELRRLRHDAHLRSARAVIKAYSDEDGYMAATGVVSSALLAGVSPKEIGIDEKHGGRCIDEYYERKDPDFKMYWENIENSFKRLNNLLGAC